MQAGQPAASGHPSTVSGSPVPAAWTSPDGGLADTALDAELAPEIQPEVEAQTLGAAGSLSGARSLNRGRRRGARATTAGAGRQLRRSLRALRASGAPPHPDAAADIGPPPERVPPAVLAALALAGVVLAAIPLLIAVLSNRHPVRQVPPPPAASFIQSGIAPTGVVPVSQSASP